MIQNFNGFTEAETLEGTNQVIAGGLVASQEAIKERGTNGGGSLNANATHPFENPNAFTNLLEMSLILLIPFALTYTFGRCAKNQRQGWTVFAAMFALWFASALIAQTFETGGNPHGLTEVTYAFTSAANNNGSACAGIAATPTGTTPRSG
jgi:K+-transporting ATPase ATPase A chain